jgi:hypothetical protein
MSEAWFAAGMYVANAWIKVKVKMLYIVPALKKYPQYFA